MVERSMLADGASPTDILVSLAARASKIGCIDVLSTVVLRDAARIGIFNLDRGFGGGFATDEDLALLGMLAPHIRRAITISDLLNLKAVEAHALGATLDLLSPGIIILAADRRILHTNEAAKRMLAAGAPIRSAEGRLLVAGSAANEELEKALAIAESDEAGMGKTGIGITTLSNSGAPTIVHVLPLARGDLRSHLLPQAVAAIFLTQHGERALIDLSAFSEAFKLTPAETRVLQQLVHGGTTMLEVATGLSISEATAKTHLSHIFAKTGVSKQTDLIALVRDLVPPVGTAQA